MALIADRWGRDASRQPAFVRFKNKTCYNVEIIWINTNNVEETYTFLAPDHFLDVNTYSTHPWIFRYVYIQMYLCYLCFNYYCLLFTGNVSLKVKW